MTHHLPCFTRRPSYLLSLGIGILAGLMALDAPAAPPAPVAPISRFADNGNGTVTDNLTGLVWLKDANCANGTKLWSDALTWVATLKGDNTMCANIKLNDASTAGQWRLPNRNELQSLIDYTKVNPALPADYPFTGVQSSTYWSSTTYASDTSKAWAVNPPFGTVGSFFKTFSTWFVWPVRGGQ